MTGAARPICFIVESGTDARLVEGLAARVPLTVLARAIPGGRAISQPTNVDVVECPSARVGFALRVFKELRRRNCAAVLVQGYGLAALGANLASRLNRVPTWMLVCSPVAEYYESRRDAGYPYSPLVLFGLNVLGYLNGRLGGGYIVLSRYLRDVVRRYARDAVVHVVPVYGVDRIRFFPRDGSEPARESRGLPPSGRIVFSSSRVAPEKDVATLVAAFAELVREGRDVYLLNRSGGYREFLELATRAGIRDRVIATDAVDPRGDLRLDYVSVDVCVQASRAEGLGFSVLEAMACGTPVVASAVGGLNETVTDGVTGWSVPPQDAARLADALRDALDRPEEARRRAAEAMMMVQADFDSRAAFDRLVAILTEAPHGRVEA